LADRNEKSRKDMEDPGKEKNKLGYRIHEGGEKEKMKIQNGTTQDDYKPRAG